MAQPLPSAPHVPPVQIRTPDGGVYPIPVDDAVNESAAYLVRLLRERKQWRNVESARDNIAAYCVEYLSRMGLSAEEVLRKLGRSAVVEVAIDVHAGEAARMLPWEFVVSEATRAFRDKRAPVVVRRLAGIATRAVAPVVANAAFVESAPGKIAEIFSFESELKLLQSSLPGSVTNDPIVTPSLAELRAHLAASVPGPDLVHLTGVDGFQGSALLEWDAARAQPGMFFRAPDSLDPVNESPADVAAAVTGAANPPTLVAFNIYNSSDLAARAVEAGATAALGFQDEIDDALAELFFASFYCAWQESDWNLLAAYERAWQALSTESVKLRGTGIVLWSAVPLIERRRSSGPRKVTSTYLKPEYIDDVGDAIEVVIEPLAKLNYSMLHNNRPLFKKFELKRLVRGGLADVRVDVVLNAGNERSQYSATFTLNDKKPIADVRDCARVSLTSEMARSLRESVYSSIYVSVTWKDRVVRQETFRVALLPTDEWQDDDLNRVWLPSFVLPRDPAVPKVVDTAQRYLMALADDAGAGFDGYQGIVDGGEPNERCRCVDVQVWALWWALSYDYALGYINPPPTFTNAAQRLRTPSDVITGRRGTCIDLTLLLAALLEYVDIRPVVFLLEGHAFPAYCRSAEAHAEVRKLFYQLPQPGAEGSSTGGRAKLQREWILDGRYYGAIVRLVQRGDLVPLESVALTQRTGFWDAVAQGSENLRNRRDFQYLIDITLAREADVTPIPVWSMGA